MTSYKIPTYRIELVRDGEAVYPVGAASSTAQAESILGPLFEREPREIFVVLLLNARNIPLGVHVAGTGGAGGVGLLPADVFRAAVLANATAVIVAHNHPSGDPSPSADDVAMTRKLIAGGRTLGVTVLDHLVFACDMGEGPSVRSLRSVSGLFE